MCNLNVVNSKHVSKIWIVFSVHCVKLCIPSSHYWVNMTLQLPGKQVQLTDQDLQTAMGSRGGIHISTSWTNQLQPDWIMQWCNISLVNSEPALEPFWWKSGVSRPFFFISYPPSKSTGQESKNEAKQSRQDPRTTWPRRGIFYLICQYTSGNNIQSNDVVTFTECVVQFSYRLHR